MEGTHFDDKLPPSLLNLPLEILQYIIQSLVNLTVTNRSTGRPYPYYSSRHRDLQRLSRWQILNLCLSCRKLHTVATPFLYRHVLLTKGDNVKTREFKGIDLSTGEPWPDRGISTLGLFLRTMIERPKLREHVHHLDCWFFLQDVCDIESSDTPKSILKQTHEWEYDFLRKCIESSKIESDIAILSHTGLQGPGTVDNLGERAFTAILFLAPKLRSVAYPPPPAEKWCLRSWGFPDDESDEQAGSEWSWYKDTGHYEVMSDLVDQALGNKKLSCIVLQNLESVRFTLVPGFFPPNSGAREYARDPDPTYPFGSGYTFQIDACLGILRGPKVAELETDGDNGLRAVGILHRAALASLRLQRLFLTTKDIFPTVVDYVGNHWSLTHLALRNADVPSYENLSDESLAESSESLGLSINMWNTGLGKLAKTLKFLDIGSDTTDLRSLQHLTCLPSLMALEHLRIGLPLLNTNEGLITRPLQEILPPNLKTLMIDDWFASIFYRISYPGEDSYDEDTGDKKVPPRPRRHQRLLSSSLYKFAGVCHKTHPKLRCVSVFGRPPIIGPRFVDIERAMTLAGPKPGDVIPDFEKVQKLFAESGVGFREFFHKQEPDCCPFRAVLATEHFG